MQQVEFVAANALGGDTCRCWINLPFRGKPRLAARLAACLLVLLVGKDATVLGQENNAKSAPQPAIPLYQQEPFDLITLDEANNNAVLKVRPLNLPGRRVPDPLPTTGTLRFRLVDKPDVEYEVPWSAVAKVQLFHDLVLEKARELVAQEKFEEAYDYFAYLVAKDPQLPGLQEAICEYLFREAQSAEKAGDYYKAFARLKTLYERKPDYPGLPEQISKTADRIIDQYVRDENFWAARKLLEQLEQMTVDLSVVKEWTSKLQSLASENLKSAEQAAKNGEFSRAHRLVRRSIMIWPTAEAADFARSIQEQYPRVVVAVIDGAETFDPTSLADWAARRSGRLLWRCITEFVEPTAEGGRYIAPLGKLEIKDLGKTVAISLEPDLYWSNSSLPLTAFDVVDRLWQKTNDASPEYDPVWHVFFSGAEVQHELNLVVYLQRPHLRPEALFQFVVPCPVALENDASAYTLGPYRLASQENNESIFIARSAGPLSSEAQPREITEQLFLDYTSAIRAMETGQVDIIDRIPPWLTQEVDKIPGVIVARYRVPTVHCLIPNRKNPLLNQPTFRRALLYGINRPAILAQLTGGQQIEGCEVVSGPFPRGIGRNDPLAYAYDSTIEPRAYEPRLAVALAQVALAQVAEQTKDPAHWQEVPPLTLGYPSSEVARLACRAIQRHLELVGIPVNLRELPGPFPSTVPDNVDLLYTELLIREPLWDVEKIFGFNALTGNIDPYLMLTLRQLHEASDWAELARRLQEIHFLVHSACTVLPLWQLTEFYAYHDSVRGIGNDLVTLYDRVENWQASYHELIEK